MAPNIHRRAFDAFFQSCNILCATAPNPPDLLSCAISEDRVAVGEVEAGRPEQGSHWGIKDHRYGRELEMGQAIKPSHHYGVLETKGSNYSAECTSPLTARLQLLMLGLTLSWHCVIGELAVFHFILGLVLQFLT